MTLLLFLLPLVWLVAALGLLFLLHGRTLLALWREPMLARPVVIVESDDWGVGPQSDAQMLERIADLLASISDGAGHPAVMTLGVVLGQADGAAILASGCARYSRITLLEPRYASIVAAMRSGCDRGVFALQRHGLEHFWPASLLARAREDETLRRWLADAERRSESLPSSLQSRWVDTSSLPSRSLPVEEIETAVGEEAALFRQVFGEAPAVAVPNTFVWSDAVERAWVASGVTCIVTPGRRLEGRDAAGTLLPPTRTLRNGERSLAGPIYVVRDDYFEPIRGHRAERVWQAVAMKAGLGRPTLLETHRESFVATPGGAQQALDELARALQGVLQRHPDVCFLSTAELARHLSDPASPLRLRCPACRAHVFLRRVQREAALARLLKASGLEGVLWLAERLMNCVTHGRLAPATR